MGACNIEFELKGDLGRDAVNKAFNERRVSDAAENGHQSGYSGDFQTVRRIDFHEGKVFGDANEAQEYCLKHAVKWETVVAVKYELRSEMKRDAKLNRLAEQLNKAKQDRKDFGTYAAIDGLAEFIKPKAFVTCRYCSSKSNTSYLTGTGCKVCGQSLLPAKILKRIERLDKKVTELKAKYDVHFAKLQAKTKVTGTRWLICGWGAC